MRERERVRKGKPRKGRDKASVEGRRKEKADMVRKTRERARNSPSTLKCGPGSSVPHGPKLSTPNFRGSPPFLRGRIWGPDSLCPPRSGATMAFQPDCSGQPSLTQPRGSTCSLSSCNTQPKEHLFVTSTGTWSRGPPHTGLCLLSTRRQNSGG